MSNGPCRCPRYQAPFLAALVVGACVASLYFTAILWHRLPPSQPSSTFGWVRADATPPDLTHLTRGGGEGVHALLRGLAERVERADDALGTILGKLDVDTALLAEDKRRWISVLEDLESAQAVQQPRPTGQVENQERIGGKPREMEERGETTAEERDSGPKRDALDAGIDQDRVLPSRDNKAIEERSEETARTAAELSKEAIKGPSAADSIAAKAEAKGGDGRPGAPADLQESEKTGVAVELPGPDNKAPGDVVREPEEHRPREIARSSAVPMLDDSSVLVIIAHNRENYLGRCLDAVAKHFPTGSRLRLVVSVDGDFPRMKAEFDNFVGRKSDINAEYVSHAMTAHEKGTNGYFALSAHFRKILNVVFRDAKTQRVILLEEDLEVAPDFFDWFAAAAPLLDADTKLMAVSAWNDNGMQAFVLDEAAAYRSEFFPGLGWMMPRRIWEELGASWPDAYWDDWLREPEQRKGRHFLRPEVCRTFHYGKMGTSKSQFGNFLDSIRLAGGKQDWRRMDLDYLSTEAKWDSFYLSKVRAAPEVRDIQEALSSPQPEVKVFYENFASCAKRFGVMDNIKAGVPRTAYKGVVSFWKNGKKIHLVPSSPPL